MCEININVCEITKYYSITRCLNTILRLVQHKNCNKNCQNFLQEKFIARHYLYIVLKCLRNWTLPITNSLIL